MYDDSLRAPPVFLSVLMSTRDIQSNAAVVDPVIKIERTEAGGGHTIAAACAG